MKKTNIRKLNTRQDAENAMLIIGQTQLSLQGLITDRDEQKLRIDAQFAERIEAREATLKAETLALAAWAEANPDQFPKGSKTLDLGSGTISWRTGTPSLKLMGKWTWERATAACAAFLPAFLRNKPEIDREAIIAQRDDLAEFLPKVGLRIEQGEKFHVTPNLTAIEQRQTVEA